MLHNIGTATHHGLQIRVCAHAQQVVYHGVAFLAACLDERRRPVPLECLIVAAPLLLAFLPGAGRVDDGVVGVGARRVVGTAKGVYELAADERPCAPAEAEALLDADARRLVNTAYARDLRELGDEEGGR